MSKQKMIKMLSLKSDLVCCLAKLIILIHIGTNDGKIVAETPNAAIDKGILLEIAQWKDQGIEWSDIICRLRPCTIPTGYTYCPWRPGGSYSNLHVHYLYFFHVP